MYTNSRTIKKNNSKFDKDNHYCTLTKGLGLGKEFLEVGLMRIENCNEEFLCICVKDENPSISICGSVETINKLVGAYTNAKYNVIAGGRGNIVFGEELKSVLLQYMKRFFEFNHTPAKIQSRMLHLLCKGHLLVASKNKGTSMTFMPRQDSN